MFTSMTQKFIMTQKTLPKKQNLLDQILPILRDDIILGKLLNIWITNYKDNLVDNDFIIANNENIEINIYNDIGKILLIRIIFNIIEREKNRNHFPPFFFILKGKNINVRKRLYNYFKKHIDNNEVDIFNTFEYLMTYFIIINSRQYNIFFNKNLSKT